jgi:hypothetical protein
MLYAGGAAAPGNTGIQTCHDITHPDDLINGTLPLGQCISRAAEQNPRTSPCLVITLDTLRGVIFIRNPLIPHALSITSVSSS